MSVSNTSQNSCNDLAEYTYSSIIGNTITVSGSWYSSDTITPNAQEVYTYPSNITYGSTSSDFSGIVWTQSHDSGGYGLGDKEKKLVIEALIGLIDRYNESLSNMDLWLVFNTICQLPNENCGDMPDFIKETISGYNISLSAFFIWLDESNKAKLTLDIFEYREILENMLNLLGETEDENNVSEGTQVRCNNYQFYPSGSYWSRTKQMGQGRVGSNYNIRNHVYQRR